MPRPHSLREIIRLWWLRCCQPCAEKNSPNYGEDDKDEEELYDDDDIDDSDDDIDDSDDYTDDSDDDYDYSYIRKAVNDGDDGDNSVDNNDDN